MEEVGCLSAGKRMIERYFEIARPSGFTLSPQLVVMTGRNPVPGLEEAPSSPVHKTDPEEDYFIKTIFFVWTKSPVVSRYRYTPELRADASKFT